MPSAKRYCRGISDSGGASGRWDPTLSTITAENCVILLKAVGLCVVFVSHPVHGVPVVSTGTRRVRSISRHTNSANSQISPRAAIRSGFFRHRLLPIRGSLQKP